MPNYEFTMPWPPSINGYWRTFRNRQIVSKRGRDYRKAAIEHIKSLGLYDEKIDRRMSVFIRLRAPTRRKYDVDNFNKAVFDALSHAGFWVDDELVDLLQVSKRERVLGGLVEVKVFTHD